MQFNCAQVFHHYNILNIECEFYVDSLQYLISLIKLKPLKLIYVFLQLSSNTHLQ